MIAGVRLSNKTTSKISSSTSCDKGKYQPRRVNVTRRGHESTFAIL